MILQNFFILFILCLFSLNFATAQQKYTLSGYITDQESGEALIGANIYILDTKQGAATNNYGFYSLTLATHDTVTIAISYLGYQEVKQTVLLQANLRKDWELQPTAFSLEEVEITTDSQQEALESTEMSSHTLKIEQIERLPFMGGETDLMKALQLLPGVQGGDEASAGLFVRGGSPDQNLILLDGVPVYNVFHLFGFISVFNTDAIQSVKLYKGGIPARFGGRLSSVLDIVMKEGNLKKTQGSFAISPVVGKFTFEAPLKKDRSSLIISARRTWLDALYAVFLQDPVAREGYNFHDLNMKINTKVGQKDRLYFSIYTGRDKYRFKIKNDFTDESKFSFRWGNTTTVLRWNHIYSSRLFSNLALSYSTYRFSQEDILKNTNIDFLSKTTSGVKDWSLRLDYEFIPNTSHDIRFGLAGSQQQFEPEVLQIRNLNRQQTFNTNNQVKSQTLSGYIEDDLKVSSRIGVNIGLRGSLYHVNSKIYPDLQPRVSLRYSLNDRLSIKSSYNYMVQYIHLLTNSSLGAPTDLWVSSTERIKPQHAQQVALGIFKKIKPIKALLSIEGYYKWMDDLIEYQEGANYLFNDGQSWQDKVVAGQGDAYGVEVLLQKDQGRINGWISYTLSWANRQIDGVNEGRTFPFKYDRRHSFSASLNYRFKAHKSLSLVFVYQSGNAITLAEGTYQGAVPPPADSYTQPGFQILPYIAERNGSRMPAYHRMDVSYHTDRQKKKVKRSWIFSIYNLYSRLNAFFIYRSGRELKQVSLFPIIPSVTYKLEF